MMNRKSSRRWFRLLAIAFISAAAACISAVDDNRTDTVTIDRDGHVIASDQVSHQSSVIGTGDSSLLSDGTTCSCGCDGSVCRFGGSGGCSGNDCGTCYLECCAAAGCGI